MYEFGIWNKWSLKYEKVWIDDSDVADVMQYSWHLTKNGYIRTNHYRDDGTRGPLYLTRLIMDVNEKDNDIEVDHINRNKLDNRRNNLRLIERQPNRWNRAQNPGKNYKGAYFHKKSGKWQATIMYCYKQIALGLYKTEIEAALAYDRGAAYYFGWDGYFNFPEKIRPEYLEDLVKL